MLRNRRFSKWREGCVSSNAEAISGGQFHTEEDSDVHVFGLHEPDFAVLYFISDPSVQFTSPATQLLKHAAELCLAKSSAFLDRSSTCAPLSPATSNGFFPSANFKFSPSGPMGNQILRSAGQSRLVPH